MDTQKISEFVSKLITLTLNDKLSWKIHNSITSTGAPIHLLLTDHLDLFEPAFELFLENKYWVLVKYVKYSAPYSHLESGLPKTKKSIIFNTEIENQRERKSQESFGLRHQVFPYGLPPHNLKTAYSLQVCDEQGNFLQEITSSGLEDLYITVEKKTPSVEKAVDAIISISE